MAFELAEIKEEIKLKGFHSIYYFEFDKNFYHTPESHDFWELAYVDSGEINATADGAGYRLTQGQVIFHRPMELHSHFSNRRDPNNILIVSFSSDSQVMNLFDWKIFQINDGSKKILSLFLAETKKALGKIPNRYEDKSALDFSHAEFGSVQLMECYLIEFLYSLIRGNTAAVTPIQNTPASRALGENSLVELVRRYLDFHKMEALSLEQICEEFYISKSYLCRLFKENTGESVMEYFNQLKIKEAKTLIRTDRYTITQIADLLGYAGIHQFSRAFKNTTGFSPLAYKKSIQRMESF